ncbi:gem-associated protein 8-like [Saccoglossus kowalevskii]|uniref:Gem-associated protein 8-like n=1 Tax=Saccoglossus kowalevskii TaxID=10224 RepID=A0ABM0MAC6_SACKO|nr:PREDICTED: gem-associated protein 8-like [Saccoglossus kowalevskii]
MSESENAFQFDLSPGQPWHQHPRFHRYWQHYYSVRDWYYNYWFTPYTLPALQTQPYLSYPFNLPNHLHHNTFDGYHDNSQPWSSRSGQQGFLNQPSTAQGSFLQTTCGPNEQSEESSETTTEEDVDEGDNFEMEVSHEMKEFFAKSEKHRKERNKENAFVAPRILYGKDAAVIHGMETALQLQFDRNCDKKQPKIWPTIPLKF